MLLFALTCLSGIGCRSLENHFVYNPSVYPNDWNEPTDPRIEDARFVSADGTQLHGLFAEHHDPKAVILFAHGRSGNVTSPLEFLIPFIERHQVSVLIFDYRGYGRSAGKPSEAGLYQDARAARQWLANRAGELESEIVLMGRSLGAAVAIELAVTDGAKGLVIENGFTSIADVVNHHAPIGPIDRILVNKFDSFSKISAYDGPLLISHGTDDEIIPFEQGTGLFRNAAGPKHFYTIDGGRHDWVSEPDYQNAFDYFIDDLD